MLAIRPDLLTVIPLLYFRDFGRETTQSHDTSINLFAVAVRIMRLIQLKALRWFGLGFAASRRRRLGCVIVAVFIVILILHFLTYRDRELVSSQCLLC